MHKKTNDSLHVRTRQKEGPTSLPRFLPSTRRSSLRATLNLARKKKNYSLFEINKFTP